MKKKALILLSSLMLVSCTKIGDNSFLSNSAHDTGSSRSGTNSESTLPDSSINKDSSVSTSSSAKEASSQESGEPVSSSFSQEEPASSSQPSTSTGFISLEPMKEEIYLSFPTLGEGYTYTVSYRKTGETNYTQVDQELVSSDGSAHILGLAKGTYDIQVEGISSSTTTLIASATSVAVEAIDRSGYAFFKRTEGVGAYNLNGTLKSDAVVLYVNDSNKNTITYHNKTGLIAILQDSKNIKKPLDIRLTSTIHTNQFSYKDSTGYSTSHTVYDYGGESYFTNTKETTYTELNGLTSWVKGPSSFNFTSTDYTYKKVTKAGDTDTYLNMADIDSAKDVTIEGVGSDIEIHQWGFTWKKCNSIEVKNLTFADYPEDACSFQGGSNTDMDYSYYFVHQCTFKRGKNNWDCTEEQDKHDGDGAMDLKYLSYMTASYNHYQKDHKTGLIGGSDKAFTKSVTFHHNYYDNCSSRLPLGRRVNLHAYNNYYYNCTTCQDMRANSYTLSENNLFKSCHYPQKVSSGAVIKSFGDTYISCTSASQATSVTLRDQKVTNFCKPDGTSDYSSFDTDNTLFYYDSTNHKSNVTLLEPTTNLDTTIPLEAGNYRY